MAAEYGRLRDLIARYAPSGRSVPILSGEWGYSAVWEEFDADRQGRLLPREWLVNAACGIPLSIWYDWRDDGLDPKDPEHHFGVVAHRWRTNAVPAFAPKPADVAAVTLHRHLGDARFDRRCSLPRIDGGSRPADWVLLYRETHGWRLAAWTLDPGGADLRLPASMVGAPLEGHLGAPARVGNDAVVRLTDAPCYIAVPAAAVGELKRPTQWDWSDGRVTSLDVAPGPSDDNMVAIVEKGFGPPLRAALRIAGADGTATRHELDLPSGRVVVRRPAPAAVSRAEVWLESVVIAQADAPVGGRSSRSIRPGIAFV